MAADSPVEGVSVHGARGVLELPQVHGTLSQSRVGLLKAGAPDGLSNTTQHNTTWPHNQCRYQHRLTTMKENRWITSEDDLLVFDCNCEFCILYLLLYFASSFLFFNFFNDIFCLFVF